jgi:Phosphodiester glycosidase
MQLMASRKTRRFLLIGIHLLLPVLIAVVLISGAKNILGPTLPQWTIKNQAKPDWQQLTLQLSTRNVSLQMAGHGNKGKVFHLQGIRFPLGEMQLVGVSKNPGKTIASSSAETRHPDIFLLSGKDFLNGPGILVLSEQPTAPHFAAPYFLVSENNLCALRLFAAGTRLPEKISAAIRGTRLLLSNGKLVTGSNVSGKRTRNKSTALQPRSALGIDAQGRVVMVICPQPIGIGTFAYMLLAHQDIGGFALRDAMQLNHGLPNRFVSNIQDPDSSSTKSLAEMSAENPDCFIVSIELKTNNTIKETEKTEDEKPRFMPPNPERK